MHSGGWPGKITSSWGGARFPKASEPVNEQKYSDSHMTAGAKHAHRVSF